MKILLIGISARAMAESAVRSGYPVIALDAFGDQDTKNLTESYSLRRDFQYGYSPRALHKASRKLSFDAVAYTSNLENHPKILMQFEAHHRLIGNSPQVIHSIRYWPALIPKLKQAGFSVPETIFAEDGRSIDNGRNWLVKPLLSGGGHGIAFESHNRYCVPGFMFQEYIPGKPCSASFVANGDQSVIIGITEQLIGESRFGAQGFRYCGNIQPLPELSNPAAAKKILEQVRKLAAFLTREYGLTGVNGVDFLLKDNRVYLTEVNPRYSASMELMERAYEIPIFHLHTQAVLDGRLPVFDLETILDNKKFLGKAILFAERDAAAPDTRNWLQGDIRDIPVTGEKLPKGSPICTLFAAGSTYNKTLADLADRAGMLKEEIYGKTDRDPDNRTFDQAGYRYLDWKRETRI